MCFVVHDKHPNEKTAGRDIPCWKTLYRFRTRYGATYHNFYYKLGEKYSIRGSLKISHDTFNRRIINRGFHSFSSLTHAKKYTPISEVLVKAIIPKGAHYYFSPFFHEYVSDSIIITGEES